MGYSGNLYAQATEVITTQGDLRRGDSSGFQKKFQSQKSK